MLTLHQPSPPPVELDPLDPDYTFERRKRIHDAIAYEFDLEAKTIERLAAAKAAVEGQLTKIEEELGDHETSRDALQEAGDALVASLSLEQQVEMHQL